MAHRHEHTDHALLSLIATGDEAAFTVFFERHRARLYYFLVRHTKSREIAEELVTDIFMKIWTARELAVQIENAEAFLCKVGYYKAMDFLRTASRHARLQQVYIDRAKFSSEKMPDEVLIDQELKELIYKAVNQLPPQRKLIYQLSREQGLTHQQIARALHLSPSTVNNTLTVAHRSIAQFIQEHSGKAALSAVILFS